MNHSKVLKVFHIALVLILDKLRKEKFPELFTDLRAFDQFVLDNYNKQKFELKNENTGESIDLTVQIKSFKRIRGDFYWP